MQFPHELRTNLRPVLFQVVTQIVTAHGDGDLRIDSAGQLVPERFGITVNSYRTVDSLPGFELLPGASMRSQHFFHLAHLPHSHEDLSFLSALQRTLRSGRIITGSDECVIVVVNIHELIAGKVYRI